MPVQAQQQVVGELLNMDAVEIGQMIGQVNHALAEAYKEQPGQISEYHPMPGVWPVGNPVASSTPSRFTQELAKGNQPKKVKEPVGGKQPKSFQELEAARIK